MFLFSVRPTLLDYLSTNKSKNNKSESSSFEENTGLVTKSEQKTIVELNTKNCHSQQEIPNTFINKKSPKKSVPKTRTRRRLKNNSSKSLCSGNSVRFTTTNFESHIVRFSVFFIEENEPLGSLQEITANYVIKYQQRLKSDYKAKLGQAWKLINSNSINEEDLKKCYKTVEDLNKKTKLLRCIENDNITDDLFLEANEILLKNNDVLEKDPFEIPQDILIRLQDFLK